MRHFKLSVTCKSVPVFPRYLINATIFGGEKEIDHEMCFVFLFKFRLEYFSF